MQTLYNFCSTLNDSSLIMAKYGWNMLQKGKLFVIYNHFVYCDGSWLNVTL
jgi:hypothetical protein